MMTMKKQYAVGFMLLGGFGIHASDGGELGLKVREKRLDTLERKLTDAFVTIEEALAVSVGTLVWQDDFFDPIALLTDSEICKGVVKRGLSEPVYNAVIARAQGGRSFFSRLFHRETAIKGQRPAYFYSAESESLEPRDALVQSESSLKARIKAHSFGVEERLVDGIRKTLMGSGTHLLYAKIRDEALCKTMVQRGLGAEAYGYLIKQREAEKHSISSLVSQKQVVPVIRIVEEEDDDTVMVEVKKQEKYLKQQMLQAAKVAYTLEIQNGLHDLTLCQNIVRSGLGESCYNKLIQSAFRARKCSKADDDSNEWVLKQG